jgi:hypothetical protein
VNWEEVAGDEEALAEVSCHDMFWIADCGEVDAGIPAEEYIDVRRYILQLSGREDSRFLHSAVAFAPTPVGMTDFRGDA